jgi:hypothetical protein
LAASIRLPCKEGEGSRAGGTQGRNGKVANSPFKDASPFQAIGASNRNLVGEIAKGQPSPAADTGYELDGARHCGQTAVKAPRTIWLIDNGPDGIDWADQPNPAGKEAPESVKYYRADTLGTDLEAWRAGIENAAHLCECDGALYTGLDMADRIRALKISNPYVQNTSKEERT